MPFKLPAPADMLACLFTSRFEIKRGAQQTDGAWCWSVIDTELGGRPVESYGGWGAEYRARAASESCNAQARHRSVVLVRPGFDGMGYNRLNRWCMGCGEWGVGSDPDCECPSISRYAGATRDEINQANRELVLITIALLTGGKGTCDARTIAWKIGWSRAKVRTRLNTLLEHGLVTAREDGRDWFSKGQPSRHDWKLTAAGAALVRKLVPAELTAQQEFADQVRQLASERPAAA